MHMDLVTIYPSPPRATAAAGAATLGAAAAAINRGGSTTVTAAATVAREVASSITRVAVMTDILCDTQAENGAVTWWTAADLDSGYRVQQFWQELEDLKPL
jgi:gamma-glutamyl phosphate reductase